MDKKTAYIRLDKEFFLKVVKVDSYNKKLDHKSIVTQQPGEIKENTPVTKVKYIPPEHKFRDDSISYISSLLNITSKVPIDKRDCWLLYIDKQTIKCLKTIQTIDKYRIENPWIRNYGDVIKTFKGNAILLNKKQARELEHKTITELPELNSNTKQKSFRII
jgi:hypothetical protein